MLPEHAAQVQALQRTARRNAARWRAARRRPQLPCRHLAGAKAHCDLCRSCVRHGTPLGGHRSAAKARIGSPAAHRHAGAAPLDSPLAQSRLCVIRGAPENGAARFHGFGAPAISKRGLDARRCSRRNAGLGVIDWDLEAARGDRRRGRTGLFTPPPAACGAAKLYRFSGAQSYAASHHDALIQREAPRSGPLTFSDAAPARSKPLPDQAVPRAPARGHRLCDCVVAARCRHAPGVAARGKQRGARCIAAPPLRWRP